MATAGLFSEIRDPAERVRELCNYACKVEIDDAIPPKRYLRSGLEMMRMAKVYQEEGNYESAFVLYTKFISLFVEKLPKHPDFKTAPAADLSEIRKKVKASFPVAEQLKAKLKDRYTAQEKKRQEVEKRLQEEMARKKAEEEARRKEIEELEEQKRKEAESKWLQEQEARLQELKDLELARQLEKEEAGAQPGIYTGVSPDLLNNQIPTAPPGNLMYVPNNFGDTKNVPGGVPTPPNRELKNNLVINDRPSVIASAPAVDRSTKPTAVDHFMSTGGASDNKFGLRDVFIPSDLPRKFLVKAEHNTLKNMETCGILAGKLRHNAFVITHLILPKQTGTSDTCIAEDEEDIFLFQEPRDLITLGWIHTHPSQTAFLSSVDMHNQYGYQAMLPEAIAIVCSPKFNETGIFSLSIERGLVEIGSCREKGFHQHTKTPPLFEDSSHAKLVDTEKVEVADLR